ncbi:MAG: VanZ family protein [Granulosicoccus sp.]
MTFDFTPRGLFSMNHLRFKHLWLGIGIALVAAVAVGSVVSIPQGAVSMNDKVLHLGVYASLMGWFAQIFRHDLTRLLLVVGLVLMGIGMEFLQSMVPSRQFEVLDMIANTSGVVLAWALAYTWVGNVLPWMEKLFFRSAQQA